MLFIAALIVALTAGPGPKLNIQCSKDWPTVDSKITQFANPTFNGVGEYQARRLDWPSGVWVRAYLEHYQYPVVHYERTDSPDHWIPTGSDSSYVDWCYQKLEVEL